MDLETEQRENKITKGPNIKSWIVFVFLSPANK